MKDEGGIYKTGTWDTKPAIFLKRSSLELKLLESVYRNSCTAYRLIKLVTYGELWPTFLGSTIFPQGISHTLFVRAQRNLAANFVDFAPGPVILCDDMHQSIRHRCSCKVVFQQLPMFADSFRLVSIHRIARALGASFLYKCPASRASFLAAFLLFLLSIK